MFGGNVLNAAIDMYAYCTISTRSDNKLEFRAADLGESWESSADTELALEGPLVLHKAIYNRVIRDFNDYQRRCPPREWPWDLVNNGSGDSACLPGTSEVAAR